MDAQASDERTGVGGWLLAAGPDGRLDPAYSCWFSEEVTEQDFPCVFRKDGTAARVIATLEALAMLLAVRAFFPGAQGSKRTKLTVVPSNTDNWGNGSLLKKLMSSKYPLSALLIWSSVSSCDIQEFPQTCGGRGRQIVKWNVWQMETQRGSAHLFVVEFSRQKEAGSSSTTLFESKTVGTRRSSSRGKSRRTRFASKTLGEWLDQRRKGVKGHPWCS